MKQSKVSYDDVTVKGSQTVGFFMTVGIHAAIVALLIAGYYPITYPLPREKGIEIELAPVPLLSGMPKRNNQQRVVENPPIVNDPGNSAPQSARVAQSNQSTKPTPQPDAKPSELSDFGDVEKPVEKPKEVKQGALFQSTSQGTEEANNSNTIRDRSLFPGVGNNDEATRTANTPIGPEHRQMVTHSLSGRSVVGTLPLPVYNQQEEGKVVVAITVDQDGVVKQAEVRMQGTTTSSTELWKRAVEAAKKSRFNIKKDAPILQSGTITYDFRLR